MDKEVIIDKLKQCKSMAGKIRIIIENSNFEKNSRVRYEQIEELFDSYIDEGFFNGFEDKYGQDKVDKDLKAYIRHQFQGFVHGQDKKALGRIIITTPEKDGTYVFVRESHSEPSIIDKDRDTINLKKAIPIKELILEGVKQIILTGAPGTGKTHLALSVARELVAEKLGKNLLDLNNQEISKHICFVQFHPSYDYTDFVEGLRPTFNQVIDDTGRRINELGFELQDGIFRKFCNSINDENYYFFIIDEINRADLSKVFGELMFGLEEDYRGKSFKTQYSGLRKQMKEQGREDIDVEFSIPKNVYIIGTMNDIDRSVSTFDFALRRRFVWLEVKADDVMENVLKSMLGETDEVDDLINSANSLNKYIIDKGKEFNLNSHYNLGPAYFGKIDNSNDYIIEKQKLWDYRIKPILEEYVRGYDQSSINSFISSCKECFIKCDEKSGI